MPTLQAAAQDEADTDMADGAQAASEEAQEQQAGQGKASVDGDEVQRRDDDSQAGATNGSRGDDGYGAGEYEAEGDRTRAASPTGAGAAPPSQLKLALAATRSDAYPSPAPDEHDPPVPIVPHHKFNKVPPEMRALFRRAITSGVRGVLRSQDFDLAQQRRDETEAYRSDPKNWETMLEHPGGLEEIIHDVAQMPDTGGARRIKQALVRGSTRAFIYQRPGGLTALGFYYVNLINAAAGGFAFLTSATGRKAFWRTFFPLIDLFFVKGGKMIVAVPVAEITEGAAAELRAWSKVYEKLAEKRGGGLRFLLITGFRRSQSYHIKIVAVVAPGGASAKGATGANFNSRALALEALLARTKRKRRLAPKSAEYLELEYFNLNDEEDLAREWWEDFARFWEEVIGAGWIVWNTPALDDYFVAAGKRTLESIYAAKRNFLINDVLAHMGTYGAAQANADKQRAIALACRPSFAPQSDQADESSDDDYGLLVRVKAKRRDKLLKRQQQERSRIERPHRQKFTPEEKLEVVNMNAKIIKELRQTQPGWAQELDRLATRSCSRTHTTLPTRRTAATPSTNLDSSDFSDLAATDAFFLDSSDDSDDSNDSDGGTFGRIGSKAAGGSKAKQAPASAEAVDEDEDDGNPAAEEDDYELEWADDEEDDEMDVDNSVGASTAAASGGAITMAASGGAKPKKRVRCDDNCSICPNKRGDTGAKGKMHLSDKFNVTVCQSCYFKLRNGAKDIDDFEKVKAYCLTPPAHAGWKKQTKFKQTGHVCAICPLVTSRMYFKTIKNDKRTVCSACRENWGRTRRTFSSWEEAIEAVGSMRRTKKKGARQGGKK
ncbi:hypothetical protein JCM10450v2_004700 [Rhodotorula kratochvilovae]